MAAQIEGVVEALMKPEAYDEDVEKIELIQTHISFVFLTGKFVYKVKKPVDFGFLDFTTLEKRKFFCEEELRVNKRLCGDMYLCVLPITKSDGEIKINGSGEVIEYAVKMKEMPQDAMMSKLLEVGRVTKVEIDHIAKMLADFHSKAEVYMEKGKLGSLKVVSFNAIQNFDQTRHLRGTIVDAETFDFIENKTVEFMRSNRRLFDRRLGEGRVRETHGDVHSGNIFILSPEEIYIFDAIEFNPSFTFYDVTAEVAFLAMDLDFHDRHDLAEYFVERYVEYSGDEELLKLLAFYECYRACVRAKVNGFRLADPNIGEEGKREAEVLTKKYFDLAYEYAKELGP
ncbi:MAG: hypothetical protein ACE5PM_08690 [Candidatus Hydrothermarchaeales archaeon]